MKDGAEYLDIYIRERLRPEFEELTRQAAPEVAIPDELSQRHDPASFVEGWICKLSFPLEIRQPLLYLQRFDTKRNPVTPIVAAIYCEGLVRRLALLCVPSGE